MHTMASALSEEQFMCCICLDLFQQPVSIPCGHNFCLPCIRGFWDTAERSDCPLCKESFRRRPELRINHALAEITEGFKRSIRVSSGEVRGEELGQRERETDGDGVTGRWDVCPRHRKPLDVYCRTEQTVVCTRCAEGQHKGHKTVAVDRESKRMRAELRQAGSQLLKMIQERIGKMDEIKASLQLSKRNTEKEIEQSSQVFTALLRSIERSQQELLEELREKQREVERRAAMLLEELEKELGELMMKKSQVEQIVDTEDQLHLLQAFPSVATPPQTKDWSRTCVRTNEHMGTARRAMANLEVLLRSQEKSLCDAELQQMQQHAVDVTFDPRTAAPWLVLTYDLKQVSLGYQSPEPVPPSPLRFDSCVCVLGQPGITTGRHYWVVLVGDKMDWDLGVARESINRKGAITVRPDQGFWAVSRRKGGHLMACAGPSIQLSSLPDKTQKVGVFVDYEEGLISFYDAGARFHIYSYVGCTFTETLYPYFNPCLHDDGKNTAPLIICPVGTDVTGLEADLRAGRSLVSGSRRSLQRLVL